MGRVITQGSPQPNTGVPGIIAGYGKERVIHSPAAGVFRSDRAIGDIVRAGDVIGYAGDTPMRTQIDGCLRGLLANGVRVTEGFKCADVDPRGDANYINYISDKATSVGGGVLEALAMLTDVFRGWKAAMEKLDVVNAALAALRADETCELVVVAGTAGCPRAVWAHG